MRIYLFLLFLSFSACDSTKRTADTQALPPPNILWITCEDISPNLGCYGDAYANTPHLDQLATEGVLYTKGFASAPVCAVARSSILSGMYASSQGTQHMRCNGKRPAGVQFYPELLQAAGYYCSNNAKTDYNFDMDHKAIWDDCSNTAHWRNRSDQTKPFFSVFNFVRSHESRVNDEKRYKQAIKDLSNDQLKKSGAVPIPEYFPNTPIVQELWARYYNIITAMDQQVGALLQQLEEDGLAENTIIIFYSDHGAGVPRHKRWLYDTGLQVPWIVKVPKKYQAYSPNKPGTKTDELISFIDLAPTALHLAGIDIPDYMEGRAFLGEKLKPQRKYIYAGRDRMDERYDMQRAVRDKRYKYIRYYEPFKSFCQYMNTPEKGDIMKAIREAQNKGTLSAAGQQMVAATKPIEALYDCEKDPLELNNLANDPAYQDKLQEMQQAHAFWSDDTKDTGLIPETILRKWEQENNMAIYDIMRKQSIPVSEIRATALGEMDITSLQKNLIHKNEAVRYWAAISLGNQAEKVTDWEVINKALNDPVPVVRLAAARAFEKKGEAAIGHSVIEKDLKHPDEWVRLFAAQILDESGVNAKPLIPALQGLMEDKNKYVVRVANHALNNLLGTENVVR